jgi:NAD dependent epimerase/dehydratase family enzyme
MDDVICAILFALESEALEGPVNLVSPRETRCRDFTSSLGRILRRPAFLPLPAFAARLVLGEMADGLLLASARVQPRVLEEAGYPFRRPTIEDALRAALGR